MKRGNIALAILLILAPKPAIAPKRVDTPAIAYKAILGENRASGGHVERIVLPARGGSFKSYMDYRAITNKASRQWELQQEAKTDSQGLRKLGNRYMVAVGSYYTKEVGARITIVLSSGKTFKAVVGDLKADRDTCPANKQHADGSIVEFIVDTRQLPNIAHRLGSVSCLGFEGEIVNIELEK